MSVLVAPKRRKPRKKKSRKKAPASRFRLALGVVAAGCAALIGGSILWAGVYALAAPPGTLLMLQRKMSGDVIIHPWTRLENIS
ncbi:MAG: hypothetical protein KAH44_00185, partial [Oricola sp.]|nr:hypothetical protein [Oricola sp.]